MDAPLAEQDLKALFLRHARQLQSYLLRKTRDPHLAADLAQESFLRLAEQRHKEPIEHVDAYLYRTAHNLTIDHYGGAAPRPAPTTTSPGSSPTSPAPRSPRWMPMRLPACAR